MFRAYNTCHLVAHTWLWWLILSKPLSNTLWNTIIHYFPRNVTIWTLKHSTPHHTHYLLESLPATLGGALWHRCYYLVLVHTFWLNHPYKIWTTLLLTKHPFMTQTHTRLPNTTLFLVETPFWPLLETRLPIYHLRQCLSLFICYSRYFLCYRIQLLDSETTFMTL